MQRNSVLDLRTVPARQRAVVVRRVSENWVSEKQSGQQDLSQLTGLVFDWMGIAEIAQQYLRRDKANWMFRGQSFPHPLRPKIGRPNARKDPTAQRVPKYKAEDEMWMLEQFKARSRPYLNFDPKTDLEWLAVAQHHSMPTRLLDWTQSFLVAVFFAILKAGVDGPATVYAVPRPSTASGRQAFSIKNVKLFQPPDISPRIAAQRGVFTVHPRPSQPYRPKRLEQWLIDSSACFNIKKQLHLCGINESVVYPDIDGLGRYLEWRYKWPTSLAYER